ncbi:hypothetical protein ENTCAN_06048 [Enterobacter cancerogenus ATCC 35316]|nr:hypothetical protein ENTCAN_06048 [Enterobacter cancerogenus ATCC 35316]
MGHGLLLKTKRRSFPTEDDSERNTELKVKANNNHLTRCIYLSYSTRDG